MLPQRSQKLRDHNASGVIISIARILRISLNGRKMHRGNLCDGVICSPVCQ